MYFGLYNDLKGLQRDIFYGREKVAINSGFVIFWYLIKDSTFIAVKRDAKF